MENVLSYITCFGWLPLLLPALLGLLLGWLLFRGKKVDGDLSIEGEGALRAEADSLRARVRELEGSVASRDTEVSGLKSKLAAAAAGAAAAAAVTSKAAPAAEEASDDDTYALEWRNRYLAARVKYLEGRLSEAPAPKAKAKAAPKAKVKAAPKPKAEPKPKAKAAPKPKVLYTDGPTDGTPDDLKLIKGIGPKFEKDLHSKGIYYFRQIGAWKAADVKMVEGVIDSIPGRIKRDEWVKQAKGLAKGAAPKAMKAKPATAKKAKGKPGPKPGTKLGAKTKDGRVRQKPGPKGGAKKPVMSAEDKYYANVKKYDDKASRDTVKAIIKHCGVALRSRDSSLVACSDATETATVAKNFVGKKLGVKDGAEDVVKAVCQEMKGERFKNRVTFYYLCAKNTGKLDMFGG
ncbi:DUF2853 family protein [Fretibacter rubidus]|uniref:DUF2853 family protein n=1 Tax=Fretibacter rubidus TaxID=570162 RepID=UPI00352B16A3